MEDHTTMDWRARRDARVLTMLDPDHPAWLIEEGKKPSRLDMEFFTLIHYWEPGGWARRHYMYDTVADVVHFWGTTPLDVTELSKLKPEHRFARRGVV